MINNICNHTNSYAQEHIAEGTHRYAKTDGSWQETIPDEINKLIAILVYFGLVKVCSIVDNYWSTKTLYHGLWAREIMSRIRYKPSWPSYMLLIQRLRLLVINYVK